MGRTV